MVTFRYPEDKEAMMTDLSFHVAEGDFGFADWGQRLRQKYDLSSDQPSVGTGQRRNFS